MSGIESLGLAASAVMAVVLVLAIRDVMRRSSFPGLDHGRLRVSGRSMKWVWVFGLFLAFVIGGPEVVSWSSTAQPRSSVQASSMSNVTDPEVGAQPERSSRWRIHLASYDRSVEVVRDFSGQEHRTERAAFHFPLWLPLALLAYSLLVGARSRGGRGGPDGRPHSA